MRTLESPLDCKEIKPVHPKGNKSWIFIGRTDGENAILWSPDAKNWLIGKDPDAGKDWRWEEKGTTEDERVGWHHQLDGYEFEQALGVGEVQGSLACCSPRGHKESDTTQRLNWANYHSDLFHLLPLICIYVAFNILQVGWMRENSGKSCRYSQWALDVTHIFCLNKRTATDNCIVKLCLLILFMVFFIQQKL